jgi:hypothetical protein
MSASQRFERLNEDEHYARRINHESGLIESICLHCYATIWACSDTNINKLHEDAHAEGCRQRQRAHVKSA